MTEQATVFTGNGIAIFQAKVIARALRTYAKTGMKVNRAYTPKGMMTTATKITNMKFKARDYIGAADALDEWCKTNGLKEA